MPYANTTAKMKQLWMLLFLHGITYCASNENKPPQRFANGSLPVLVPKRTTLDDILKAYNISNLLAQPPGRFKRQSEAENKLRENTIDLIVADIYAGNYTAAKARFLEINDQALTYTIADKMASNPNNENLLMFIKELPWLLHRMIGYEALMKKNNLGYSIFTLEQDFNGLIGSNNDPNVVRESQHIINFVRENLKDQLTKKLELMVSQILTKQPGDYNDMIVYSKAQQKPFNAHLEELVEKLYQNSDNDVDVVEQILVFSNALTQIGQSARVYIKLYKLMEQVKDFSFPKLLKIAFKVKELYFMVNYKNTDEPVKKEMYELKEKMPWIIKSIIWNQVCIKHEKMGMFLHETGPYDSQRSNIVLAPDHDLWEFESDDDANSFKIRHVKTKEYLYADIDQLAYSTFKRRVFTWRKDKSQLLNQFWVLEDLKWRQGKIFIKNRVKNEYLNGEEVPEQGETVEHIAPELEAIAKKDAALAGRIQQLLANAVNKDRMQAFTWRRRSRGNQPEWIIVDGKDC